MSNTRADQHQSRGRRRRRQAPGGPRAGGPPEPLPPLELPAISYPAELPISAHREEIIAALTRHRVLIVAGETGSGKTTQLPKMCLEAGRGRTRRIACTQPRRIAATATAARVSEELGEHGQLVGYKIRFQSKLQKETRIKFMTDGILLAETQADPQLSEYDTIIIDEAHERSLNIDFLLGYLKKLLEQREDLSLVITSATIDTEKFSRHFGDAPVVQVAGRGFPVEVRYQPLANEDDETGELSHVEAAAQAVRDLCRREGPGDVLVFMPTERDIRETVELLSGSFADKTLVLPLFGRLSAADQNRIFHPAPHRKIVVATNVAETSVTVPGIRFVVDTGLARVASYNPRARTTSLPVVRISRASCDQRRGRCGRTGPGICVRLYAEEDYSNRAEYTLAEIRRSNLAEVILRMAALGLGEPGRFPFIDPPAPRSIQDGYRLLTELGAMDQDQRLTRRGRFMARLPLDPQIARILLEARDQGALAEATVIAAALSIQDPRSRPAEKEKQADAAHARWAVGGSDFLSILALWQAYQQVLGEGGSSRLRRFCRDNFLSFQRMREWRDIHEQILSLLREEKDFPLNPDPAHPDAVHRAVLSGFLRNIGLKKSKNIYQGTRGKELTVFPGSGQYNRAGQWIVAAELMETSKLFARTVATIDPDWLEPLAGSLCRSTFSAPRWEKHRGQVVADERVTLFGLPIVAKRTVSYARVSDTARDEAREIFIQAALVEGGLQGRYGFLEHNQKLVARLEDLEDRLRQRGIVADDRVIHRFYTGRLGEICDQAGLNRLIRERGRDDSFLRMSEDDLLLEAPNEKNLEAFPKSFSVGDFSLDLSYKFNPGAGDDGVTVTVPQQLLTQLPQRDFQWLVPGLLEEKIGVLLRRLPKSLRRQLIPIPESAALLTEDLAHGEGDFLQELCRAVLRRFGVRTETGDWDLVALPPHLAMRFQVVDGHGARLKESRSLAELSGLRQAESDDPLLAAARKRFEKQVGAPADLDEIPKVVELTDRSGRLCGKALPALVVEEEQGENRIVLRLFADPAQAAESGRNGLLHLYQQNFGRQVRELKKECAAALSSWQLYEGLGTRDEVREKLQRFVLESVFDTGSGQVPSRHVFEQKIQEVSGRGLLVLARDYLVAVKTLLAERRATLDKIGHFEELDRSQRRGAGRSRYAAFRGRVAELVPPGFLDAPGELDLRDTARYLKALQLRVERAHLDPAKDAAREAQLRPFAERLASREKSQAGLNLECCKELGHYKKMLEEFAVSLFAQEIGTRFPVSAKRLDAQWRQVQEACR